MLTEIDTLPSLVPDSRFQIRPAEYFLTIVSYTELLKRIFTIVKKSVWPDSNDSLTGNAIHTKTTPSLIPNNRHLHVNWFTRSLNANFKFLEILKQRERKRKAPKRTPNQENNQQSSGHSVFGLRWQYCFDVWIIPNGLTMKYGDYHKMSYKFNYVYSSIRRNF
jgi:hypothetical protein